VDTLVTAVGRQALPDGCAGEYVHAWQDDGTGARLYDVCGSSQFPGSSLVVPGGSGTTNPARSRERRQT
jgi:hypothetical protein